MKNKNKNKNQNQNQNKDKDKINFISFFKKINKILNNLLIQTKIDFSKIKINQININVLNDILIKINSKSEKLKNIANIFLINSQTIKIIAHEKKNLLKIEKVIKNSNLDLNPFIIKNYIKILTPKLTEEKRKKIIKILKKKSENIKISIRNIRRIFLNKLKKKILSKNEEKIIQNKIQKIIDNYILNINELTKQKENEILKI